MPEIHIPEMPVDPRFDEIRRLAAEATELEQVAAFAEWLGSQSDTIKALGAELVSLQGARRMSLRFEAMTIDRNGAPVYIARCANGYHESRQSLEHAVFLLVDSFRTREEDKPEVHARLMAAHFCTVKEARAMARELAADVRSKNPNASGEARDAAFRVALKKHEDELEASTVEPARPKEKPHP